MQFYLKMSFVISNLVDAAGSSMHSEVWQIVGEKP